MRDKLSPITGRASNKKVVEERRKIIMEMIMKHPTKKWSYRMMAEEARKLPWFREFMPSYGSATAHRDYLAVLEETKERREQLAEQYLVTQLDALEESIYDVSSDIISLGGLTEMVEKVQSDYKEYTTKLDKEQAGPFFDRLIQITKFVKAKESLYNTMLRLQKRQSALVPMEVARELNVTQQTINLDMFIEARKQMELNNGHTKTLDDGNTVDGVFEE